MASGSLDIRLRPLRLAFLVNGADKEGVLEAIHINTSLWGGAFNPIIPVFKRSPKQWREEFHSVAAREMAEGLLDAFDPDFIVLTGKYSECTVDVGYRKVISSQEILTDFEANGTPAYGVGLFEILNYLLHNELKYVRRQPLDIRLPHLPTIGHLFLASVFGELPSPLEKILQQKFEIELAARRVDSSLMDFPSLLAPGVLFLRRLANLYVRPTRISTWHGDCVFLLDATNVLDVIDYWNLRAVGWNVVPIPRQSASSESAKKLANDFVEEQYYPLRGNPQIYHQTTFLKSRCISEGELHAFVENLDIPRPEQPQQRKFVYQHSYPRIWDGWARDRDGAEPSELEARTRSKEIKGEDPISFRTLDPRFAFRFAGNSKTRFANVVAPRNYSRDALFADVIPEGDSRSLVRAIGGLDFDQWRFSKKGPTYLSNYLFSGFFAIFRKAKQLGWTPVGSFQTAFSKKYRGF